jgi:glycine cleavage system H protein
MAEIKYTKDHEWLKIEEGNVAVIGITDFAQDALGDLVYVELPEMGATFTKGDDFAVVESVKTAAEVYTPVSGEVVGVNEDLSDDPEIMKKSMDEGWIAKIKMTDEGEISAMMSKEQYDKFLEEQDH